MWPYLHLGPLALRLPGLLWLVGLWLGLEAASRQAARLRLSGEQLTNMVLWALGGGVVAARLGYALHYPQAFLQAPLSLFSLNPQTLEPTIGGLAALLVAVAYGQRHRLPLRPTLDALAPGILVLAFFGALANASSGDAYGQPTTLPWGIELWGARRHPTQFYDALLTAALLLWLWRATRQPRGDGTGFLQAVGGLAAVRLFTEAFRGDSLTLGGGVRVAQVAAAAVLLAVVALYPYWRERGTPATPKGKGDARPRDRND